MNSIIIDLDGTLCNIDHRLHYVRDKRKNWRNFFLELVNDKPNQWCIDIINAFSSFQDLQIIFCSGRPDDYREQTEAWLNTHITPITNKWILLMRKKGDYRQDSIVKEEIFINEIKDKYNILFVIDDRKQVVDKWRELGLTCLQCAEGDF